MMLAVPWLLLAATISIAVANPGPLSVPISQRFEGSDGPWSTFAFGVGTSSNYRSIRLLPSTYLPFSWLISPIACLQPEDSDSYWPFRKPGSCDESRGNTFSCDVTGSCTRFKDYDATAYELIAAANLSDVAVSGIRDQFSIGWPPASKEKTISGLGMGLIDSPIFPWTGLLGLDHRPSNFTDQGGMLQPQPSLLETLHQQSTIGSVSYSYTAGAYYRNDFGSLILGGMDQNQIDSGNLDPSKWWKFYKDSEIPLRVNVPKITSQETSIGNGTLTTSTAGNIYIPADLSATIDSTRPYFLLPRSTCDDIARFLGGRYDDLTRHYLISESQHALNQKKSLKLSIQLGGFVPEGQEAADQFQTITLPYKALALNLTYPQYGPSNASDRSWSTYIPILPAPKANVYVLGRALLQESVITVDYGREKFFLAPVALQKSNLGENLVSISCAGVTPCNISMSPVLIAGIVSGVVGLIGIVMVLCFVRRRRRKRALQAAEAAASAKAERMGVAPNDYAVYGMELDGFAKQPSVVQTCEVASSGSPSTAGTALCETHATPFELDSGKELETPDSRAVIRVYYEMDTTPPERSESGTQGSGVSSLSLFQTGTDKSGFSGLNSGSITTGVPRLVNIPPTRLQPALTSQNPIYNSLQANAVAINQTPPLPPMFGRSGERTPASPIPPTPLEFYGGFRRDGSHIPTPIAEEVPERQTPFNPSLACRTPGVLPLVTFTPATPPTSKGGRKQSGEWI